MHRRHEGCKCIVAAMRISDRRTRWRARLRVACVAIVLAAASASAGADEDSARAPSDQIVVIGRPPLGDGLDPGSVPAHVQRIGRDALEDHALSPLTSLLSEQIAGASFADTQGSAFNATLSLRGHATSPVLGVPQGIAVFQDGVRRNDPFGDVVHWALVPDFAIEAIEVQPGAHPLYGLNALGGAVLLESKSGFTAPGARLSADGSSHPAGDASLEYGVSTESLALYGGARGLYDAGWRDHSPADLQQGFVDLGRRSEQGEMHLSLGLAAADFIGNGASPRELLDEDRRAVFTRPDRSTAQALDVGARGFRALGERTSLTGAAYYRHTGFETLNGDTAEFEACAGDADFLCTDAGGPDEQLLVDAAGQPISSELDITGAENETRTRSRATGGVIQLVDQRRLFGRLNHATAGLSADLGFVDYRARSRAGELGPTREVDDLGFYLGGDEFQTRLSTANRAFGLHVSDTWFLSQRLSATVAARANHVTVDLDDLRGSDLNGAHTFFRVDPALGAVYRMGPSLALYAGYAEAQRAPTPAELSCADPERGCRVPNAFTADPPLDPVVARTVEAGARGALLDGRLRWSLAGFASWNEDDILFVASGPVLGSGYFTNAGRTRRLGVEASLDGGWRWLTGFVRYGWLDATFDSNLVILSPNHPDADERGRIDVHRGDRLPNLPAHVFATGIRVSLSSAWSVGARVSGASSRRYQGDESNQMPSIPGYALLDLETRYRLVDGLQLQLGVRNVLDTDYATAGLLGDPGEVFPELSDPRFQTPGAPRTFVAAVRLDFFSPELPESPKVAAAPD